MPNTFPSDVTPWDKTEQEIIDFLYLAKQEFDPIDNNQNIATNFQISKNNFLLSENYQELLAEFIKYLLTQNSYATIVQDVINQLLLNKIVLTVNSTTLAIGTSITLTVLGNTYRITRDDAFQLTITVDNIPTWNPENIIVTVKNSDGIQISNIICTTSSTNIQVYSEDQFLYGTGDYKIFLT